MAWLPQASGDLQLRNPAASGGRPSYAIARVGIVLAIACYAVNAMDRTLFPLILPEVAREYGFSLPQAGLMSTVFTIGMAIAGLPAGYLMSHYARKTVAQAGVFIFSAVTILTIAARGFDDMLAYRALTGVGEAMQLTALFAIVSSYFPRYRAVAIGVLNCSFGIGAIIGPLLGAAMLSTYGTWRAPMIGFGLLGFAFILLVALSLPRAVSEAAPSPETSNVASAGGAATLRNRNTVLLVALSVLAGLAIFGFLGMYPTYLRQELQFSASDTGRIMSIYGLGVLLSVGGGLLGDALPMRPTLVVSFLIAAFVGWLLFNGSAAFAAQAAFAFAFGVTFSGAIYVNLAACHVKAVTGALSARASGLFVTSFYAAASGAGYMIGWLATKLGWTIAGDIQLCGLCLLAVVLSFILRPGSMAVTANFRTK